MDGLGLPNTTKEIRFLSSNSAITTETWNEIQEPWSESGVIIAKKGYKWITKWEEGQNYIITKIIDVDGGIVGYYCDISSRVKKLSEGFELFDWYLDVWQENQKEATILDGDELEEALKADYISEEDAEIARNSAKFLIEMLNNEDFKF